jgi:hypothetical protein
MDVKNQIKNIIIRYNIILKINKKLLFIYINNILTIIFILQLYYKQINYFNIPNLKKIKSHKKHKI